MKMPKDIKGGGDKGNPPGKPGTVDDPAVDAEGLETEEQPVTRKDLDKYNSDLRAEIGRLKTELSSARTKPPASTKEGDDETPAGKTLRERLVQLEERDTNQRKKALRSAIRDALRANGADPELAEMAVPAILESEAERFVVADTKFGDFTVKYGESEVADWAKAHLQSPAGKRLLAARSAPSVDMPSGSPRLPVGVRLVPGSLAHTVSEEDLRSGKVAVVPG
jgi:hypothetical protein